MHLNFSLSAVSTLLMPPTEMIVLFLSSGLWYCHSLSHRCGKTLVSGEQTHAIIPLHTNMAAGVILHNRQCRTV